MSLNRLIHIDSHVVSRSSQKPRPTIEKSVLNLNHKEGTGDTKGLGIVLLPQNCVRSGAFWPVPGRKMVLLCRHLAQHEQDTTISQTQMSWYRLVLSWAVNLKKTHGWWKCWFFKPYVKDMNKSWFTTHYNWHDDVKDKTWYRNRMLILNQCADWFCYHLQIVGPFKL